MQTMEILEVVSVHKFKEFNANQKEELCETLLELAAVIDEIPKKSLRNILNVTLAVLQYKGEQLDNYKESMSKAKTDSSDESYRSPRLLDENDQLKRMLDKLEGENSDFKDKIKQLTDEIFQLQRRSQDAAYSADGSDKDSSDPLSELDKQEELLRNINRKNKHIKRLLREIESLQQQNIEQSKTIIDVQKDLQQAKAQIIQLSQDITIIDNERKAFKDEINGLNIEVSRLEGNINYLEEERETSERDFKSVVEKYELKTQTWRALLEDKDNEIKQLNTKLDGVNATTQNTTTTAQFISELSTPNSAKEKTNQDDEYKRLINAIDSRDKLIEQLELKIKAMAEEMIASTNLMNQLTAEKLNERNPQNLRTCCKTIEESLRTTNARCQDLSEMLESVEEDNLLKSEQALLALSALGSYQRGEDGLKKALHKCIALEQRVMQRDRHIKKLVNELNTLHEINQENKILRKRLNISEDVILTTRNLATKERNKDKIIERLTLKLRASEEMRLQLKLDRYDLKRELLMLQRHSSKSPSESSFRPPEGVDSLHFPSEMGEIEDSIKMENSSDGQWTQQQFNDSNRTFSVDFNPKYEELLEENQTLRIGMYEILEKLRDYQSNSEHITIDSDLLSRLLSKLHGPTITQTPTLLHKEVDELKQREDALRELLQQEESIIGALNQYESCGEDVLLSMEDVRDDDNQNNADESLVDLAAIIDTSTRPTTPNKQLDQTHLPMITDGQQNSTHARDLQKQLDDLLIYKKHYEDLSEQLEYSTDEIRAYCLELDAKVVRVEMDWKRTSNSYTYMKADYDRTMTNAKQNEINYIQQISEISNELCVQQLELKHLQTELDNQRLSSQFSDDDYRALLKENNDLRAQLAYSVEQGFRGQQIGDICTDYGIISDNMQLDFITAEEYEKQQKELKLADEKQIELKRNVAQLESLLEIAQNQIRSQQKLLNEITDNHINLRHLVADLQSTTEEKLLLAKMQRDLDSAKSELINIKFDREQWKQKHDLLKCDIYKEQRQASELKKSFQNERNNKDIKIKFLQKSTEHLVSTTMPPAIMEYIDELAKNKFTSSSANNNADDSRTPQMLIKLIKSETQCKLLEESQHNLEIKYECLQHELAELRLRYATEMEHWQMIEALFANDNSLKTKLTITTPPTSTSPTHISTPSYGGANDKVGESHSATFAKDTTAKDAATNTEIPIPAERKTTKRKSLELVDSICLPFNSPIKTTKTKHYAETAIQAILTDDNTNEQLPMDAAAILKKPKKKSDALVQTNEQNIENQAVQTMESSLDKEQTELENQLKLSLQRANNNGILLQQTQQSLAEAKEHIKELKEQLVAKEQTNTHSSYEYQNSRQSYAQQSSGLIEKTILSFHTLLSEKDKSINKYQDLLQSERNQSESTIKQLAADNENYKITISTLNMSINSKDMEILELKTQLETVSVRCNLNEKLHLAAAGGGDVDDGGDNSINELTDEKIEEMFQQEATPDAATSSEDDNIEKQDTEQLKEVPTLLKQITELKDKIVYLEKTIKTKEEELNLTKEKLQLQEEREKSVENNANPESEELHVLLEEKDKHINDLMDTLNNFHDDQQRYIADSSNYSADQISKLAADLKRTETTNKIYQTQVEALRRQLSTLTLREKQARELNQSLRNQLIKRPVVSIKTELNARVKNENLQKRVQQLELELDDARTQIQRQQGMLETKRARCASEVGLWEKQKRWQQSAEKYKAKLEETECVLEKTRTLLQSARNTMTRLEKDKQVLEVKLGRAHHVAPHNFKCCRTPSCLNIHPAVSATCHNGDNGSKYTLSESPEIYTGGSSECSSPASSTVNAAQVQTQGPLYFTANHSDLIEALKGRIELQQRKIIAMELEGKGTNALTTEMEKLQERYSVVEAQNIRLEAKNLQLQLDNDLLRQCDATDRLQKRIKHLEDYIITLKEEMANTEARREFCKCSKMKTSATTQQVQSAEQTILSLRRIVEKLRAENRYLKDDRRSCESKSSSETPTEVSKLQKLYTESLEKITALQIELNIKSKCTQCASRDKADSQISEDLRYVKDQLIRKSRLLQKAKVLLTRAAAKEKVLKEQLGLWKRKCSELQNVPVIDEISDKTAIEKRMASTKKLILAIRKLKVALKREKKRNTDTM